MSNFIKKNNINYLKLKKNAVQEGLNQKYKFLIFDDGLQETKIDYDMKFVCFKLKNWIGNGQLILQDRYEKKFQV